MTRRGVRSVLAMAVMLFAATPACLASGPPAQWQSPMRLGVDAGTPRVQPKAASSTAAERCSKWRRIADRLGETLAGLRLRQTVVARTCDFAGQAPVEEPVWSWPWARAEIDGELPPRLHASFGAWAIRCGWSGLRERCALIHETEANIMPGNGASERVRLSTHFVIDEIGGQERVLWRVFVERGEPHWFESAGQVPQPSNGTVRAHGGAVLVRKPFDGCGRFGCQMEAEVATAARVASRLWDGGELRIEVRPAAGLVLSQTVPAAGFKLGLGELSKLKRREQRVIAVK